MPFALTHTTWHAAVLDTGNGHLSDLERVMTGLAQFGPPLVRIIGLTRDRMKEAQPGLRWAADTGLLVEVVAGTEFERAWLTALATTGVARVALRLDQPTTSKCGDAEQLASFVQAARDEGLRVGVITLLDANNVDKLDDLAREVAALSAHQWLVGPSLVAEAPLPNERLEGVMRRLATIASSAEFGVCAMYAPFYARICAGDGMSDKCCVVDERCGLYVNEDGEITPDPAVSLVLGRIEQPNAHEIFLQHPLLRALHEPDAVEGKCGDCRYRVRCGGSRVRAYLQTGNLFASDPACFAHAPGRPV